MIVPFYPSWIQFETSTICNGGCITCGNKELQGFRDPVMDPFLVGKLIDDMEAHREHISRIIPFVNGEPLLYPPLFDLLGRLSDRVGPGKVLLNTNASLLYGEQAEKILQAYVCHAIENLDFSVDGMASYEKVRMGLKRDEIYANIEWFLLGVQDRSRINVHMTVTPENINDLHEFMDFWDVQGIHNSFMGCDGRNGSNAMTSPSPLPCARILWSNIYILSDSTFVPCCVDYLGKHPLGSLRAQSVSSVWHGPAYTNLRLNHLDIQKDRSPLCRDCTAWY